MSNEDLTIKSAQKVFKPIPHPFFVEISNHIAYSFYYDERNLLFYAQKISIGTKLRPLYQREDYKFYFHYSDEKTAFMINTSYGSKFVKYKNYFIDTKPPLLYRVIILEDEYEFDRSLLDNQLEKFADAGLVVEKFESELFLFFDNEFNLVKKVRFMIPNNLSTYKEYKLKIDEKNYSDIVQENLINEYGYEYPGRLYNTYIKESIDEGYLVQASIRAWAASRNIRKYTSEEMDNIRLKFMGKLSQNSESNNKIINIHINNKNREINLRATSALNHLTEEDIHALNDLVSNYLKKNTGLFKKSVLGSEILTNVTGSMKHNAKIRDMFARIKTENHQKFITYGLGDLLSQIGYNAEPALMMQQDFKMIK